jgi:hypothetical protein
VELDDYCSTRNILRKKKPLAAIQLSVVNEAESVLETFRLNQGFTEQIDIA